MIPVVLAIGDQIVEAYSPIRMSSLSSKTAKNLQMGLFFIDAAVMWDLEPLGMTIYIHTYTCRYTSIAFQSAVRQK